MAIKETVVANSSTLENGTECILRKKYTEVREFNEELAQIVQDLKDTLHSDSLSVGLAAPQIGYQLAVAVVNPNKDQEDDLVLINPKVTSESGSWDTKYESCMSVLHKKGQVRRRKKIHVQYYDIEGNKKELQAKSFMARVIMHEIDHLNGILYTDKMDAGSPLEDTDIFREHDIT